MSVLEGKVAVEGAVSGVLGHLLWFTIYESLSVTAQDLIAAFQAAGVSAQYLPGQVKPCDAFRRATSSVERRRVMGRSGGTYRNLLVVEVCANKDEVERHLVLQEVDADGRELWHLTAARFLLRRRTGDLEVEELHSAPEVSEAVSAVRQHYRDALGHYKARHLREILSRMLWAVQATAVRPSGGVYFVPVQHEAEVQAMRSLLRALKQEFFAVPLVDSADSRGMVGVKFREQISEMIARYAEVLKGEAVTKGELVEILNRTRDLLESVEDYQKLLEEDMQDLASRVELVREQARLALERVAVA